MKKTYGRLVSALAALLLLIQTTLATGALGSAGAANANAGIMPIASTETAVTSSELGEFNQYWEMDKSVTVFETVQGTGNITGVSAVKLYLNESTAYVSPVKNPISGNYGMRNKQSGEYWMVYKYNNAGGFMTYHGASSNVSLNYHTGFTDSDYVNMSYAHLGSNLYKDEDGRIFFKAYAYTGVFTVSLFRAYFTKTGIEVLYIDSVSAYPDNANYIHVASSSGSGGGGSSAGNKVDSLTEAYITLYTVDPYSATYTGRAQTHPLYPVAAATVAFALDYTATDAGSYTFFMVPKTGYTWQDGGNGIKTITWTISPATPEGELPGEVTVAPYSETEYGLVGSGALVPTEGVTFTCDDPDVGSFEGNVFHAGGKVGAATVTATFAGDQNLTARTWTGSITVERAGGVYLEEGGSKIAYPTLQAAYDALPAGGGTIYILGDVTVEEGLETVPGKNVTVRGDEGAATLTRAGDFTTFTVTDGAALTLEELTVTAASGEAENGGAAYVGDGGSLTLTESVTLTANNAAGKGGAVYVASGAGEVTVAGASVGNNQAAFGNGIYLEDGAAVKISGPVSNLGDGIAIGYDPDKTGAAGRGTVDVTEAGALDAKLTVEFERPAEQLSGETMYVVSENGSLTAQALKDNFLVRNPGYTFKVQEGGGLYLDEANTVAAALENAGGGWTDYADPQAAIDAAPDGATVYFATYTNETDPGLNTAEVLLSKTLSVEGKTLTFASVNKNVPADNDPVYSTGVAPVTVKRADGNTEALVYVSDGAALTLGNVTLDGGAVWPGGRVSVSDDGAGGAGTAVTNNTGLTAHAPVVVNNGALTIEDGATIQNNDNNYAAPGAGFGSQNYGGGVRNEGRGALTMTGGVIRDCYAREGGGIMNVCKPGYGVGTSPSVTASGGSITGCMSQQKGAAIQTIYGGANTTVMGGDITGNTSLNDLGALCVEEGGALTVSGGTVDAGAGANALYLYNKYSAEDYAGAADKPFIEGEAAGALAVTGAPGVTGAVHIDDACAVVDTGERYEAYVDLTGYAGGELALDFTGGGKSFGKVAQWDSATAPCTYPAPAPDGASNVFYAETAEGGMIVLSRCGYALEFLQTEANKLAVSGSCDESLDSFTVEVDGNTYPLTVESGVLTGEIAFSGGEGRAAFESTLKPVYGGEAKSFDGPTLDVLLFNSADKTVTAPAGTAYLTGSGAYEAFSDGAIPEDAALDRGVATFRVGDSVIAVTVGRPQDPPALEGEVVTLADVTDASLTLNVNDAFLALAFRLSREGEGGAVYTAWQSPADGQLAFAGLTAETRYTVQARAPEGAGTLPSEAVACPGGVFVTLTGAQNQEKAAFEAAYDAWKADTAADPAAALAQYDTLMAALPETTPDAQLARGEVTVLERERLAELQAARNSQAAQAWLEAYLPTMEDATADPVPAGTKEKVAQALEAYDELPEEVRALVDEALTTHQDGGEDAPLPGPLAAYRNLTAAEIREAASAMPEFADFGEAYANAVQSAPSREAIDGAKANFESAIQYAREAKETYDGFIAANPLSPRGAALAREALEAAYGDIASAAGDDDQMAQAAASIGPALERARDVGAALEEYLDSRRAVTGEVLPVNAQTGLPDGAQEALDMALALEEAPDTASMNERIAQALKELLDGAVQGGSDAVQQIAEEGKAAVDEAVANAGGALADFSALVDEIMEKISAQLAAEGSSGGESSGGSSSGRPSGRPSGGAVDDPSASDLAALDAYRAAAADRIEALAAQYGGADLYPAAREELAALKESMLDRVDGVTLSQGLSQAQEELDALVEEAESRFAQKAAQGRAQAEYLDSAAALTGARPDPAASPAQEALAGIAQAEDVPAINQALARALDGVLRDMERPGDAREVTEYIDGVRQSVAARIAAADGQIAEVSDLLADARATVESLRAAAQSPDDSVQPDDSDNSNDSVQPDDSDNLDDSDQPDDPDNADDSGEPDGLDNSGQPDGSNNSDDSDQSDDSDSSDDPDQHDAAGKRAEFARLKAELLRDAEKLLREHDGERVREVYDRYADLLGALEFAESAPEESVDGLRAAYGDVERETRQAQRLQRFENSARARIAQARETGRYDGEALDRLLDTYTALAAQLPAEGLDGDPQGDMEALDSQFAAELDALRGPAVDPWLLTGGLAALFGGCVAVQLLFRGKKGKREKTGR